MEPNYTGVYADESGAARAHRAAAQSKRLSNCHFRYAGAEPLITDTSSLSVITGERCRRRLEAHRPRTGKQSLLRSFERMEDSQSDSAPVGGATQRKACDSRALCVVVRSARQQLTMIAIDLSGFSRGMVNDNSYRESAVCTRRALAVVSPLSGAVSSS